MQITHFPGPYGTGVSKYAAVYRQILKQQSEYTNVATFKLVEKAYYARYLKVKGAKPSGEAKYLTMASIGESSDLDTGKKSAWFHSEQNIIRLLHVNHGVIDLSSASAVQEEIYRGLSFEKYWIAWIYTERMPCGSDRYESCCLGKLTQLHSCQKNNNGPEFTCYYSFSGKDIGSQIREAIPVDAVQLSKDAKRNLELKLDVTKDTEMSL